MTSDGTARPWMVCGTCHRLRGAAGELRQRCRCEASETWPGWDISQAKELCRACGLVVLRSGSRWSVWLCDVCKPLAVALNRSMGRVMVPIGRHSLMHGLAYRPDGGQDVDAFTDDLRGLVGAQDRLDAWAGEIVGDNLAVLGVARGADVALEDYQDLIAAASLSSRERCDAYVASLRGRRP